MATTALDWYETAPLADGITRIRERWVEAWMRCNMWHVRGRRHDVIIDTGFGLRPLVDEVAALRERPVVAIASHTHVDHVGGHHQFAERWAHRAEADVLTDPDDHRTVWDLYRDQPLLLREPEAGFRLDAWSVPPAPVTRVLDDGDVIDLGDRVLEVVHLPGHSPGSICLLERATRTLFTGDVVYDGALYDHLFHSDRELYRESLARLLELPADTFHGGHDESFGRHRLEQLVDDYLSGRMPSGG
jgi:glyoxylase-like metal-dependent hydrolase (beta-lactamase superfamily II)